MSNNNNNIQIAMLDLSDQNKAILDFYFSSAGESLYTVVEEDQADVLIMDYDYPNAKEHLAEIKATSKKPVVLLSINEQSIPATVWLAKPLTAKALTNAAEKVKDIQLALEKTDVPQENLEASEKTEELQEELYSVEETLSEEPLPKEAILEEVQHLNVSQEIDETDILRKVQKDLHENTLKVRSVVASSASLTASPFESNDTDLFEDEEHLDFKESNESDSRTRLSDSLDLGSIESEKSIDLEKEINLESSLGSEKEFDLESSLDIEDNLGLDVISVDNSQPQQEELDEEDPEVDALLDSLMNDEEMYLDFNDESDVESKGAIATITNDEEIEIIAEPILEINDAKDENLETDSSDELLRELLLEKEQDSSNKEATPTNHLENSKKLSDHPLSEFTLDEKTVFAPETGSKEPLFEENFTRDETDENPVKDTFSDTLEVEYKKEKVEVSGLPSIEDELDLSEASLKLQSINPETSEEIKKEVADNVMSLVEEFNEAEPTIDAFEDDSLTVDTDLDSLLKEVTGDLDTNLLEQASEVTETSRPLRKIDEEIADVQVSNNLSDGFVEKTDEDNDLQTLLNEVRNEANKQTNRAGLDLDENGATQAKTYQKTNAEKRWIQICGDFEEIKHQKEVASISYNLNSHLLYVFISQMKAAVKNKQVNRIKYRDLFIVLDHSRDKVYCDFSITDDRFAALSFLELNPDDLKVHELDNSEIKAYRLKAQKNPEMAHSFESFIWTASLLTSKGRLQSGTEVNKKVGLKAWPNLTRMELMPHAMQIAAVFSKRPGSLLDIPTWMNIDQRYVFAFYNAALALNLIETDATKLKKAALAFSNKGKKEIKAERGFFGRLLKRLKS